MTMLMYASVAGAGLNLAILGLLAFVYATSYRQIRTGFTLGLLVFAGLFVVQNAVTLWSYLTMMSYYAAGVELHVAVFTWAQTVGLAVLAYVTWQ